MKIYNVGNTHVNIYLLDSGTNMLLLDCGYPGEIYALGRAMRQTGYTIKQVDYVCVTHFHVDHAGAVPQLKEEGAKFILFDCQTDHIQPMEKMIGQKWKYSVLKMDDNIILPVAASRSFLHSISIAGEIIQTPGHSNDSVSLLLDSGEVFTGDLQHANAVADEDVISKQSWQLLKNKGGKIVYPGHGNKYVIS